PGRHADRQDHRGDQQGPGGSDLRARRLRRGGRPAQGGPAAHRGDREAQVARGPRDAATRGRGTPLPGRAGRSGYPGEAMAYLDHAATTPMLPEAIEAMTAQLGRLGNASSLHASGRRARRVLEEARENVASALGARPSEVVFTSG